VGGLDRSLRMNSFIRIVEELAGDMLSQCTNPGELPGAASTTGLAPTDLACS
jgi:hypothetical protein